MPSDIKNVKLGVCKVFFDGRDLGLTQGGVEVAVATETHKVEVDQFGKTAINDLIMGRNVNVKVPLAETTVRNLIATMPGSSLVTDGAQATGTVAFGADPTSTTTVTIGGQVFSFQVAKATTAYQVQLGATRAASVAALAEVITRAPIQKAIGGIVGGVSGVDGSTLTIKVNDPGVAGNSVTLASSVGPVVSGATLTGGIQETKARVEVTAGTGLDLLSMARVLRLHPTNKADTDFSDDFVVYQAATAGALTFAYKLDAERVYNVEFMGYPDTASGKLFAVGDLLA